MNYIPIIILYGLFVMDTIIPDEMLYVKILSFTIVALLALLFDKLNNWDKDRRAQHREAQP